MSHDISKLTLNCLELQQYLENPENPEVEKTKLINNAIETALGDELKFPEFGPGLEWFNTSRALSLAKDLKGSVIVLDFFTYCCINCMHILPDLKALEEKYPPSSGVLVIGIHSAKFENEKVSSNISAAISRYGIHHPVVNDGSATIWNKLGVSCWPTLLILSPDAVPLFTIVGEGHRDLLFRYVEGALSYFGGKNELHPTKQLPLRQSSNTFIKSDLLFPGKVTVSHQGLWTAQAKRTPSGDNPCYVIISDSGHNRLLVVCSDGRVKHIIGGPDPGFMDGNFSSVRFNNPQGTVWCPPHHIFVADTGNHAIRKVDLDLCIVDTVAGTGAQGTDKEGGKFNTQQSLASPWDVCLWQTSQTDANVVNEPNLLLIANTGTHQIWGLALKDLKWWKGSEKKTGECFRIAGSGAEENRNNSYPHRAAFAQPSGLCVAELDTGCYLYIADSESSSVRQMSLADGSVKGLAGGDKDPTNLFAYGDQDNWDDPKKPALLQHPLGVAWNLEKRLLYVADSYNHKIKQIDPRTRQTLTLAGNGKSGLMDGKLNMDDSVQFSEPGGLCFDEENNLLYVADTNNHCIRRISITHNSVETFCIFFDEVSEPLFGNEIIAMESVQVPLSGATIEWDFTVIPNTDWKFSEEAPHSLKLHLPGEWNVSSEKYIIKEGAVICRIQIPIVNQASVSKLQAEVQVFLCGKDSGVCKSESFSSELHVRHTDDENARRKVQHSTVIRLP